MKQQEYTFTFTKINLLATLFLVPFALLYLLPFVLIWDYKSFSEGWDVFISWFFAILIPGVVVHELLHGITWAFYTKAGFRAIKFGVNWKFLTPYCHCKEPLRKQAYFLGGAMPFLVLGLIPAIIGLALGNALLVVGAFFFSWAAGGDLLSIWMMRNVGKDQLVQDHPEKVGFIVYED